MHWLGPRPPAAAQMCKRSNKPHTECPRAAPGYHGDGWAQVVRSSANCEQEAGVGSTDTICKQGIPGSSAS